MNYNNKQPSVNFKSNLNLRIKKCMTNNLILKVKLFELVFYSKALFNLVFFKPLLAGLGGLRSLHWDVNITASSRQTFQNLSFIKFA